MTNRKRQGNNPKRRIASVGELSPEVLHQLSEARYVGSAHHKSKLADYHFSPPTNPRPDKSLCDGIRVIKKSEAAELFQNGISREMVSAYVIGCLPKYVWAVDSDEEAYESVISKGTTKYHGYRLEPDDPMRSLVIEEWNSRKETCLPN